MSDDAYAGGGGDGVRVCCGVESFEAGDLQDWLLFAQAVDSLDASFEMGIVIMAYQLSFEGTGGDAVYC